jgi:hypothetical protein
MIGQLLSYLNDLLDILRLPKDDFNVTEYRQTTPMLKVFYYLDSNTAIRVATSGIEGDKAELHEGQG